MLVHIPRAVAGPFLVVALVATAVLVAPTQAAARACPLVAHRGEHTVATENGLRALRRAVRSGAEYLEMDVRTTKDNRLVLMHDRTVGRTTDGRGRVRAKTARQVGRLRLDDGGRVPSLRRALGLAARADVRVMIDVKAMGGRTSYRRLARQVKDFGPRRAMLMSRHREHLDRFGRLVPRSPRALVTGDRLRPRRFARYDAAVVQHRAITLTWLRSMRRAGVPVYAWTLNREPHWDRLSGRVAGVITDVASDYAAYRRTSRRCG